MPLGWVMVWAGMMESELAEVDCTLDCWAGWSNSPYIWLLTAPMMSAYFVSIFFFIDFLMATFFSPTKLSHLIAWETLNTNSSTRAI